MFQNVERYLEKTLGVEYISKEQQEKSKERFNELIKNAQNEIWVVAGELNPEFYGKEFAEAITQKIKMNNAFRVRLLFSKDVNTETEIIDKIKEENDDVVSAFKQFPDNIEMYRANRRPQFHFDICDNNVYLERKHKANAPRAVLAVRDNEKLAKEYKEHFGRMLAKRDIVVKLNLTDFSN